MFQSQYYKVGLFESDWGVHYINDRWKKGSNIDKKIPETIIFIAGVEIISLNICQHSIKNCSIEAAVPDVNLYRMFTCSL